MSLLFASSEPFFRMCVPGRFTQSKTLANVSKFGIQVLCIQTPLHCKVVRISHTTNIRNIRNTRNIWNILKYSGKPLRARQEPENQCCVKLKSGILVRNFLIISISAIIAGRWKCSTTNACLHCLELQVVMACAERASGANKINKLSKKRPRRD